MVSTFFQEKIDSASQINFGQRKRICGQRSNREEMKRFCKIIMWWYREWATFTLLAIMSVELPLTLLQQSPVAIGLIGIQPVTTGWLLLRLGWIIQACLHTARQIPSSILVSIAWHILSTKVSTRRHVTFARCSQADIQNWRATELICCKKIGKTFMLGGVTSAAAIVDSCSLPDMQMLRVRPG